MAKSQAGSGYIVDPGFTDHVYRTCPFCKTSAKMRRGFNTYIAHCFRVQVQCPGKGGIKYRKFKRPPPSYSGTQASTLKHVQRSIEP